MARYLMSNIGFLPAFVLKGLPNSKYLILMDTFQNMQSNIYIDFQTNL